MSDHDGVMSEELGNKNEHPKTPFNKKKWREQKYSGKAKVQKWENIKRKQSQRQFTKELSKVGVKFNSNQNAGLHKKKSLSALKEAQMNFREMQRIKAEKQKEQERIEKEKREAIKAYKEKKAQRFRKLSQKTRKGQPLMRTRIELLLEKIQKEYANCAS